MKNIKNDIRNSWDLRFVFNNDEHKVIKDTYLYTSELNVCFGNKIQIYFSYRQFRVVIILADFI